MCDFVDADSYVSVNNNNIIIMNTCSATKEIAEMYRTFSLVCCLETFFVFYAQQIISANGR